MCFVHFLFVYCSLYAIQFQTIVAFLLVLAMQIKRPITYAPPPTRLTVSPSESAEGKYVHLLFIFFIYTPSNFRSNLPFYRDRWPRSCVFFTYWEDEEADRGCGNVGIGPANPNNATAVLRNQCVASFGSAIPICGLISSAQAAWGFSSREHMSWSRHWNCWTRGGGGVLG